MKEKQDINRIKSQIVEKKKADHSKIKRLMKIALICTPIRVILYLMSINGFLFDLLWLPMVYLVLAIPFYGFEWLLDRIKK